MIRWTFALAGLLALAPVAAAAESADRPKTTDRKAGADGQRPAREAALAARLKSLDKNRDGKISRDEVPAAMERIFERVDVNCDGVIDKAELAKVPARSRTQRDPAPPPVDVGAETASHEETKPLPVKFQRLACLRFAPDGNLVAGDTEAKCLKIITPAGQLITTIEPGFGPEAVDFDAAGTIYCGGQGRLAKLDVQGRVLTEVTVPKNVETPLSSKRRASSRPVRVSGIAVADDAVFVAFGSGWSLGSKSKLFRFDLDLQHPKLLAEGLRGCCQRCDIVTRDGVVYLAENSAHRIVSYDHDGTILNKWGERSRTELAGFGSCCNPMNLGFDASGVLYTAESGLGRVKRYTTDGKYLGLVGYVGVARFTRSGGLASSCSNMALAIAPQGERVYVIDLKSNSIRVLLRKG